MPDISLAAQLQEARRELVRRQVQYPRWVCTEQMTPAMAAERLASQAAIVETLEQLVGFEALAPIKGSFTQQVSPTEELMP